MDKALAFVILFTFSCNQSEENTGQVKAFADHEELKTLYEEDQSDRMSGDIDWSIISKKDSSREARVYELLDSNLVLTANDHYHAAMIFQHGNDTIASGMAVKMMRKAVDLDSTTNKWLLAAAIDRDMMRRNEPQIYGTQYTKHGQDEPWVLYDIDTTQVTDRERKAFGVETLAEQQEKVKLMNKKKLSDLLAEGRTIDEIIKFCTLKTIDQSAFDLSEQGINQFGYQLLARDRNEDALMIFEMNTDLYPEGFNTYESYGECLLKLGRKEEAIAAYQKSLELNPENTHAEQVLADMD